MPESANPRISAQRISQSTPNVNESALRRDEPIEATNTATGSLPLRLGG
jgi:hypothetical protein